MKETVNRFEEEILTTSNLSEMKDKYLAETLYRKWPEIFVDESTGELVNIERKEIIFDRGTFLDHHNLEEINFFPTKWGYYRGKSQYYTKTSNLSQWMCCHMGSCSKGNGKETNLLPIC